MATEAKICQALLVRAGRGDVAAFGELYDRTAPKVFGLVRKAVPDEAEDVTVEVYQQVWQAAPHYNPDDDACNLLMSTALAAVAERRPRSAALSLLDDALSPLRPDPPIAPTAVSG